MSVLMQQVYSRESGVQYFVCFFSNLFHKRAKGWTVKLWPAEEKELRLGLLIWRLSPLYSFCGKIENIQDESHTF